MYLLHQWIHCVVGICCDWLGDHFGFDFTTFSCSIVQWKNASNAIQCMQLYFSGEHEVT